MRPGCRGPTWLPFEVAAPMHSHVPERQGAAEVCTVRVWGPARARVGSVDVHGTILPPKWMRIVGNRNPAPTRKCPPLDRRCNTSERLMQGPVQTSPQAAA